MKGFIEVNEKDQKVLINIDLIFAIQPYSGGDRGNCDIRILISAGHGLHIVNYRVEETYEDVKTLIESASQ